MANNTSASSDKAPSMAEKQIEGVYTSSTQGSRTFSRPPHCLTSAEVVAELETNADSGLTDREATSRLETYGRNSLGVEKGASWVKVLIAQFVNPMLVILLGALAACAATQAWYETGFLGFIIVINIGIGFYNEYKAERSIADLNSLSVPKAVVIRGGATQNIDAELLVPGDVILLKTGDSVPADARLIEAVNLEADEASLTGESVAARKDAAEVLEFDDIGAGDRTNIVFSSSKVEKGRGKAVVFATGLHAETGTIATSLRDNDENKRAVKRDEHGKASAWAYVVYGWQRTGDTVGGFLGLNKGTPLQRKMSWLFLNVLGFAFICALVVAAANKFLNNKSTILYATTIAIATLPVTIVPVLRLTEALGAKVMRARNVLVRHMPALEALGGVTDICSDKTGTLTQGKMVVETAWVQGHGTYTIKDIKKPFNPRDGVVSFVESQPVTLDASAGEQPSIDVADRRDPELSRYLAICSFANLATISEEKDGDWQPTGEPTEVALRVFAAKFGQASLEDSEEWKLLAEFPFDSTVKKMSVLCRNNVTGQPRLFTKGAVERVLESCKSIMSVDGGIAILSPSDEADIVANMEALARRGFRVLALADSNASRVPSEDERLHGRLRREEFEQDLIFRGLIGIYDPPRLESRPSVLKCHEASINVHMLTGDHPETARAIAIKVGILPSNMDMVDAEIAPNLVMTAQEFDMMSDEDIHEMRKLPLVVARCSPTTKVRMVKAIHRRGGFVAMTGDGVNDSPALKHADVGIAMGISGSDVAKSVADIVLSDDNFASILNAVEEGRRIFDNIQKFVLHVLAANVAFVFLLLLGLVYKDDEGESVYQCSPTQILVILLVAGAFTETGLGCESASPDILHHPPHSGKSGVFSLEFKLDLVAYGLIMAISLCVSFVAVLRGMHGGRIGDNCNLTYSEGCDGVFRSRSTCFATMLWVFVLFAWVLIDSRRSFFDRVVTDPKGWRLRLWRNQPLFWSVIGGFMVPLIFINIPATEVTHGFFLHTPIQREWGVVVGMTVFFLLGAEAWKFAKRRYLRGKGLMLNKDASRDEEDIELRAFADIFEKDSPAVGIKT